MSMIEFDIYAFCDKIMSTSSTNEKKAILRDYSENDTIRRFLKFLYDKNKVTGISTGKLTKNLINDSLLDSNLPTFHDIFEVTDYLSEHNTGRDVDVRATLKYLRLTMVKNWIYGYRDSDPGIAAVVNLMEKIVTKSLKLGIDTKLVNTAIPGLIPVHEVQQAYALKNAKLKGDEWICLSQKLNGNRATFVNGKLLSRQGKEFSNLSHIVDELNCLESHFDVSFVFDGEIIRKNPEGLSDNANFTMGTGILNSKDTDKTSLSFVIFDMLPYNEFLQGESSDTYKARYAKMRALNNTIENEKLSNVEIVPFLYAGYDHSKVLECLELMDSEGKEGCMLARDVTYKCKRHNGLLKVKTFYTMDLKVIGMEEGTGKNKGTVGSLLVEYKGNIVGVGSGLTDEMRADIWSGKVPHMNRIIEVKYKDITRDKNTGMESLQFPVFVGFREEGKSVSYD